MAEIHMQLIIGAHESGGSTWQDSSDVSQDDNRDLHVRFNPVRTVCSDRYFIKYGSEHFSADLSNCAGKIESCFRYCSLICVRIHLYSENQTHLTLHRIYGLINDAEVSCVNVRAIRLSLTEVEHVDG